MSVVSSHVVEAIICSPNHNCGDYDVVVEQLVPSLYSVTVYCRRYTGGYHNNIIGAWGYADTAAEAQQLGESLESLFQLRHTFMKEQEQQTN